MSSRKNVLPSRCMHFYLHITQRGFLHVAHRGRIYMLKHGYIFVRPSPRTHPACYFIFFFHGGFARECKQTYANRLAQTCFFSTRLLGDLFIYSRRCARLSFTRWDHTRLAHRKNSDSLILINSWLLSMQLTFKNSKDKTWFYYVVLLFWIRNDIPIYTFHGMF